MEQQQNPVELAARIEDTVQLRSTVSAALAAGTLVKQGDPWVYSPFESVAADEIEGEANEKQVTLITAGPTAFKKAAVAFTAGAKVYWDDTAKVATNTDATATNDLIGWAKEAAGANDDTVFVDFDGYAQLTVN